MASAKASSPPSDSSDGRDVLPQWATRATPQTLRIYGWVSGGLALALAVAVLLPLAVSTQLATLVPLTRWQKLLLGGLLRHLPCVVVAPHEG